MTEEVRIKPNCMGCSEAKPTDNPEIFQCQAFGFLFRAKKEEKKEKVETELKIVGGKLKEVPRIKQEVK